MKPGYANTHWYNFLREAPRSKLLLATFYGLVRVLTAAAWPYVLYNYLQKHVASPISQIGWVVTTVIVVFVVTGIASHRQSVLNIAIMENFSLKLVERMWAKMINLEWLTFHSKNRVYFFDALMVDAWRLRQGLMALLEFIIVNGIVAVALTLFIVFISPALFIVCVAGLLLIGGLHFYSTFATRPRLKHFHDAWRRQHYWVAKTVDQFDLIKMDRAYHESAVKNRVNTSTFLASNADMLRSQSKWRAINQAAGNMVRVIIFITGLYWVQIHYINLTDLLLTLLIVSIIQNNLMQFPSAVYNFVEGLEAESSIATFFSLPDEQKSDQPIPVDLTPVESVSISGLAFSYDGEPAIRNIAINLEKGKVYLWKGANGSGKSTSAHILLGLLTPQNGTLQINGQNVPWETLKQLRKRFAFVNQDAPLFMGSLKENVLFGHPEPLDAWNKVQQSWLAGMLPAKSDSGNRQVGDRGEGLSGGEARRLALVREWLREADIFIMDEPLNHLDEHAINEIKQEIVHVKTNAIVIIISHQKGFEAIADEIKQF